MGDRKKSKLGDEDTDFARVFGDLVRVFGTLPRFQNILGTSELRLRRHYIFDSTSRSKLSQWSMKIKLSCDRLVEKCTSFQEVINDIQKRKSSQIDNSVQMTALQGAHFNFCRLQIQDYLVTKLQHFKMDEICSRLCHIYHTSTSLPWLRFDKEGERCRKTIVHIIIEFAQCKSYTSTREHLANSTYRALVAGIELLVSLRKEVSFLHGEITEFGLPFQSAFAVSLLQRCIDGKIQFTKHMLDMLKKTTEIAIAGGRGVSSRVEHEKESTSNVESRRSLPEAPDETWNLTYVIDRVYELTKLAECDTMLPLSLRHIHGEAWTMENLNQGDHRCNKILSMLRDYADTRMYGLVQGSGKESDQIERAHRVLTRRMYESPFSVESRFRSEDMLRNAVAGRQKIAAQYFARRKYEDVFNDLHKETISMLQTEKSTSRADTNDLEVLVEFLRISLLDRIRHFAFIDILNSEIRKIRRKVLRRSPRSLSAVAKYVAELYVFERPDYASATFEERNERDDALKRAVARRFGPSVRKYLPLLLVLMRSLDVDIVKKSSVRPVKEEQEKWEIARRLFSKPPYSNGSDYRYNSVKQYLRSRFGKSAITDVEKPRLKYIARNRGIEDENGDDGGGRKYLRPRTPGWFRGKIL